MKYILHIVRVFSELLGIDFVFLHQRFLYHLLDVVELIQLF